jgi:hypothetical protein
MLVEGVRDPVKLMETFVNYLYLILLPVIIGRIVYNIIRK